VTGSVWLWRGFAMLGLLAGAIAALVAADGYGARALPWALMAIAWVGLGGWLRRQLRRHLSSQLGDQRSGQLRRHRSQG
jgi:hypothetical protein